MKTEEKTKVSEVGFEPGTFRSRVEHSIHYATETPPIPDVLLVLVAPKYINRNVTATLQSRFNPTPTPRATLHPKPTRTLHRPSPIYTVHLALLPRPVTDLAHLLGVFHRNPYLLTLRIWRILKNTSILLSLTGITGFSFQIILLQYVTISRPHE